MTQLECRNCGSKETFIATCLYKYLVNSQGEQITPPEMDELPEYQCEKCGAMDIEIETLV